MFLLDLVNFIDTQTSLTLDTNLFLGRYIVDAPDGSVSLMETNPGTENDCGLMVHPIQVLAKDKDYVSARTLLYSVHDVLRNKPGFSGVSDVFYCEVIKNPMFISVLSDGSHVFGSDYLVRRRYSE
jgi:hypothetical protein